DHTINLDNVDLGYESNQDKDNEKKDKKRKRKAPNKPRKRGAESVGNTLIQSLNLMKTGALLECINGWGIKNVMTMTVDNIASNDKALEYLLENLPTKYDDGDDQTWGNAKHAVSTINESDSEEVDEDINLEEPLGQAMSHANKGNSVPHG
ncbi:hypothetical protein Tco_1351057, partial [Tanacetum coccineum]